MKATIQNNSTAPQGVHTVSGPQFIEPGASRELDVADDYVERVNSLPFLSVTWAEPEADKQLFGGKGDHDDNGAVGGARHPNADQYEAEIADLRKQLADFGPTLEARDASIAAMRKTISRIPLPDHIDDLKRDELDALAAERGVDITEAKNKGDVIAALQLSVEQA